MTTTPDDNLNFVDACEAMVNLFEATLSKHSSVREDADVSKCVDEAAEALMALYQSAATRLPLPTDRAES